MKKILFLMITALIMLSCGKDEEKDQFYEKSITSSELESGTATYVMVKGYSTYYLVFSNGTMGFHEYKNGKFTSRRSVKYSVNDNDLKLTENLSSTNKYYTLYIAMVHWGYDKTTDYGTGGDQLQIRGDDVPYGLETGFYDKSSFSLN